MDKAKDSLTKKKEELNEIFRSRSRFAGLKTEK